MTDVLTPKQRSYCMSRIRSSDTSIEITFLKKLRKKGLKFKRNFKGLPGKPDFVFPHEKILVFIDGDFWHGYRLPSWKKRLSKLWLEKITRNRKRDVKNFRKLRKMGWKVFRFWEHQIEKNSERCIERLLKEFK